MLKNALYLIPVTLGDTAPELVLPAQVFGVISELDEFIVENARSARRFLRRAGFDKNFENVKFHILNKHTTAESASGYIDAVKKGKAVGLLSEAGVPCIADPGAFIVNQCHTAGVRVIPLTGPSSIILALMGSGFNGQNFAFHGYLPIDGAELKPALKELESAIFQKDQTQIFIETPYRNHRMLNYLTSHCNPKLKLCIAAELTTENELIMTRPVKHWKDAKIDIHKKPAVFLLYK